VKLYTGAIRRVGHQIHHAAVENLVAQGVIRKLTTTRTNSFILELAKELEAQKTMGASGGSALGQACP